MMFSAIRPRVARLAPVLALVTWAAFLESAARAQEVAIAPVTSAPAHSTGVDRDEVSDVVLYRGGYHPRVDLDLPPGRSGMAPAVGLVYDASRSNGPLGAGWGLTVDSAVERRSFSAGEPRMDGTDVFFVDGEELVAMVGGTYRTAHDDFTVYRQQRNSKSAVVGWTATKEGHTTLFGASALSLAKDAIEYRDEGTYGAGAGAPVKWLISGQLDGFGNAISYEYEVTSYRHYLSRITYNGGTHAVDFGYEQRPDVRSSKRGGLRWGRSEALRLRRVVASTSHAGTQVSHYYLLAYDHAAYSPQSLVREVTRLEVSDPASPPTAANEATTPAVLLARFEYEDSETRWEDWIEGSSIATDHTVTFAYDAAGAAMDWAYDPTLDGHDPSEWLSLRRSMVSADFDGDSLADVMTVSVWYVDCAGCGVSGYLTDVRVFLNETSDRSSPRFVYDTARSDLITGSVGEYVSGAATGDPWNVPGFQVIEVNRDGKADILLSFSAPDADDHPPTDPTIEDYHDYMLLVSDGDTYGGGGGGSWLSFGNLHDKVWVDVDGDGADDLAGPASWYRNRFDRSSYFDMSDGRTWNGLSGTGSLQSSGNTATLDWYDTYAEWVTGDLHDYGSDYWPADSDEWRRMHTVFADFDSDGIQDALVNEPSAAGDWTVGPGGSYYDQLSLGAGTGGFYSDGLGVGGVVESQQVTLTATVDTGLSLETVTMQYGLGDLAIADVDGDGRVEITRHCDDGSMAVLWDRGVANFGMGSSRSCPATYLNKNLDLDYFGANLFDTHDTALVDLDGDSFPDVLSLGLHNSLWTNVTPATARTTFTETEVPEGFGWGGMRIRFNARATAQNRLTQITRPHGGTVSLEWSWSALGGANQMSANLPVIASVSDANGTFRYRYSGGVFEDGRFRGFQGVTIDTPAGAEYAWSFNTTDALQSKPNYQIVYDAQGRPRNLTVFIHGLAMEGRTWAAGGREALGTGTWWLDATKPYVVNLLRRCDFELEPVPFPLGFLDAYLEQCEQFAGETGVIEGEQMLPEVARRVLWGTPPDHLGAGLSDAERALAEELWATLNGRADGAEDANGQSAGPSQSGGIDLRSVAVWEGQSTVEGPWGRVFEPRFPGASFRGLQGEQPRGLARRLQTELSAGIMETRPGAPVDWVGSSDYEMYVAEWDHDNSIGQVTQERLFRNVSTQDDTLVGDLTWSGYDASFEGAWATSRVLRDAAGVQYGFDTFSDFTQGQWQTKTECGRSAGGGCRSVARAFNGQGELSDTWDAAANRTTMTYDACGLLTSTTDPIGYTQHIVHGSSCWPDYQSVSFGSLAVSMTEEDIDGYGRVVRTSTSDPGAPSPAVEASHAYDPRSTGTTSAAQVTAVVETDGTTTLTKAYVDGYGRRSVSIVCQQDGAASSTTGNLDARYPCLADTQAYTLWMYYEDTGFLAATAGPFSWQELGEGTFPATLHTYDELGRVTSTRVHEGGSAYLESAHEYGLQWESITNPLGVRSLEVRTPTSQSTYLVETSGALHFKGSQTVNAAGLAVSATDAEGNLTDYEYDEYNRLAATSGPEVDVLPSGAITTTLQRPTERRLYYINDVPYATQNANGDVTIQEVDAAGRPTQVWGPDGVSVRRYEYTEGGHGTRQVVAHDDLGNLTTQDQDGLGRTWRRVEADGQETSFQYDLRGRVFETTLPWGERVTSTYDRFGAVVESVSTRDASTSTTSMVRDVRGNLTESEDPDGELRTYEYDALNRLTWVGLGPYELTAITYDAAGRVETRADAGAVTHFEYDEAGLATTTHLGWDASDGSASVQSHRTYREDGQVDTEVDGEGHYAATWYDALGRARGVRFYDSSGALVGTRTVDLDAVGRSTRLTDEEGLEEYVAYDGYGRRTRVTPAGHGPTTLSYQRSPSSPLTGSPLASLAVTTVLPTGEASTSYTDGMGRTHLTCKADRTCTETTFEDGLAVATERYAFDGTSPVLASTKRREYEPSSSRLAREWDWMSPTEASCIVGGDASACSATIPSVGYAHTAAGRADTVTDAAGNLTSHVYAGDGSQLLVARERQGIDRVELTYDPAYPRVQSRVLSDPSTSTVAPITEVATYGRSYRFEGWTRDNGLETETLSLTHDGNGRPYRSTYQRGTDQVTTTHGFDARGRLTDRVIDVVSTALGTYSASFGFGYYANGMRESVSYPSGQSVHYGYTQGLLTTVADASGNALAELSSFDASGRAHRTQVGGVQIDRTFDVAGREASRTITNVGVVTRSENLEYDDSGRLWRLTTVDDEGTQVAEYAYDARDALTKETHDLAWIEYHYDAAGRRDARLDSSGSSGSLSYAAGNRLASVNGTTLSSELGRVTRDQRGQELSYGLGGQLVGTRGPTGTTQSLLTDADGVRVLATSGAAVEQFYGGPAPGELLESVDGAGQVTEYVRLPDGGVLMTRDATGAVTPVLTSATGSPYLIGAYSSAHLYVDYSAFGEERDSAGTLESELSFHFMAKPDDLTGIRFAGLRAYDVDTGRFLAPDPLGLASASDINDAADLYRYAHNNPVRLADPSGLSASPAIAAGEEPSDGDVGGGGGSGSGVDVGMTSATVGYKMPEPGDTTPKFTGRDPLAIEFQVYLPSGVAFPEWLRLVDNSAIEAVMGPIYAEGGSESQPPSGEQDNTSATPDGTVDEGGPYAGQEYGATLEYTSYDPEAAIVTLEDGTEHWVVGMDGSRPIIDSTDPIGQGPEPSAAETSATGPAIAPSTGGGLDLAPLGIGASTGAVHAALGGLGAAGNGLTIGIFSGALGKDEMIVFEMTVRQLRTLGDTAYGTRALAQTIARGLVARSPEYQQLWRRFSRRWAYTEGRAGSAMKGFNLRNAHRWSIAMTEVRAWIAGRSVFQAARLGRLAARMGVQAIAVELAWRAGLWIGTQHQQIHESNGVTWADLIERGCQAAGGCENW